MDADGRAVLAVWTYLRACPFGDARTRNYRQNEAEQHKHRQGRCYEHWILDSVAVTKAVWAWRSRGITITRSAAGDGSSQHTRCQRPHFRHAYWPCEGHIASVCINLHQRSAIRAWASFIECHSIRMHHF